MGTCGILQTQSLKRRAPRKARDPPGVGDAWAGVLAAHWEKPRPKARARAGLLRRCRCRQRAGDLRVGSSKSRTNQALGAFGVRDTRAQLWPFAGENRRRLGGFRREPREPEQALATAWSTTKSLRLL